MDTIHDLGGGEGFGPIHWQDDDDSQLFHEPWQARTWAMCMLMIDQFRNEQTGWTLDWHRHVIERIAPADYLSMASGKNPYGDGQAAARIASILAQDAGK